MAQIPVELCLGGAEVNDVLVRPGGEWFSAVRSEPGPDGTSTRLVMWSTATGEERTLLQDPQPLTGRGLSGGVHDWHPDGRTVVVVTRDGVVTVDTECGVVTPVTPLDVSRSWSTPVHSADGSRIAVVADWCELVVVDDSGAHTVHREEDGYVMDAAWFGDSPTALRWSRPDMQWTCSGLVGMTTEPGVSVQQPRSNGGVTGWITDATGAWNVRVARVDIDDACEHGGPVWGPGSRTWCVNDAGTHVAFTRNEKGFGSLWVADLRTGERSMVGRAVHGCVSWHGDTVAALRSGARTPKQIVTYDMSDPSAPVRTRIIDVSDPAWRDHDALLVEPTVHDAAGVPYRMYTPPAADGRLIVWAHGGPADQWQVEWRPRFTYWLSRGFTVVVVDYRGSTGHGRAYLRALDGGWGVVDADDVATVARHAHSVHGFAPERTVLMGGSAGGIAVLGAAARHAAVAACVVTAYPVVDLGLMLANDDPFEGHYVHALTGDVEDSPNRRPGHLEDVPVLSFHGELDALVEPRHSFLLKEAVEAAGGSVEVVLMPGEGHGFRNADNVRREFDVTGTFIDTVFARTGRR